MKLSTHNWLFRWAYLFKIDRDYVRTTTLCAIFWRSVLLTPLVLALISLPVVAIAYQTALNGWWWLGLRVLMGLGALVVVVGIGALCAWLEEREYKQSFKTRRDEPSVIRGAIKGIKERYCPIVYIEPTR